MRTIAITLILTIMPRIKKYRFVKNTLQHMIRKSRLQRTLIVLRMRIVFFLPSVPMWILKGYSWGLRNPPKWCVMWYGGCSQGGDASQVSVRKCFPFIRRDLWIWTNACHPHFARHLVSILVTKAHAEPACKPGICISAYYAEFKILPQMLSLGGKEYG